MMSVLHERFSNKESVSFKIYLSITQKFKMTSFFFNSNFLGGLVESEWLNEYMKS